MIETIFKSIIIILTLAILFVGLAILTNEYYQNDKISNILEAQNTFNNYCFEE